MCIHKKMRSKRLAPVLIKEVTRRCHEKGIFQAIYTGGVFLPTPVSRCQCALPGFNARVCGAHGDVGRYFHRNLNPPKLIATGFSAQPRGVSMARLNRMYSRPATTELSGWREMVEDDLPAVAKLTRRYLARFELAQVMDDEEIRHAFLNGRGTGEASEGRREGQVVWTFVVEVSGGDVVQVSGLWSPRFQNPATSLITDVVSFSFLPSTAMRTTPHQTLEAAYLFLYATTVAPACADLGTPEGAAAAETNGELKIKTWLEETSEERRALKKRLMALIGDALTVAQKVRGSCRAQVTLCPRILYAQAKFDVFNALTILDNTLFLSDLQFGPGDGYLHYYLYNWKGTSPPALICGPRTAETTQSTASGAGWPASVARRRASASARPQRERGAGSGWSCCDSQNDSLARIANIRTSSLATRRSKAARVLAAFRASVG